MRSGSDDLFRASFDSSTSLMAITRADDGVQIDVNRTWQDVLGYGRDEAIGRTSLELGIWHEPDQRRAMLDILERDGVVRDFRATLQSKSGERLECLINMSLLDSDGEAYLLFSAYDITAVQSLQDEAKRVLKRNEIANRQAKIAFWRWSLTERRMTDWSEVHALFTPGRGPAPTNFDEMLAYLHPDDRERVLQTYLEADKNISGYDIEFRVIDNNGEIRWLRGYAEVEYDEDGEAIAQIGFDQDITEIKMAQETLRHAHDDLEQRVQDRTRELNVEIEQRREINRLLRESEARYAQAERIAHIYNWTSNAVFDETLSCSQSAEQMLKVPVAQLLGPYSRFFSQVHPDDVERMESIYTDVSGNPRPYEIEYRFCPPDGSVTHLSETGEPVYDDDGTLILFRGTTQDITARVERDEELRRTVLLSQQAAKMAGLGQWFWDEIEDRCVWCNEQTPAMYGLTMDAYMESRTVSGAKMDSVHPDDRDRVRNVYMESLAGAKDYEVEYRVIHPDGTIHWLRETSAVYETVNSQVRSTIGTILDLTNDKLAQQALVESESLNRSIVETAADGIITIDERGVIESFNRAAERIFGFRRDDVIGKNVEYLMPEPFASNHDEYLRNYMRTGNARIIGIGREVEGLREDGTTFPMLLAVSEVESVGKRIFTGIIRDISDFKAAEQSAIDAKEEAERANAAKTDFLAHMSHEFRTPLNAIIGFSETMSKQVFGELGHPKYAGYALDIMHSGHLLLDIVNDILDISKVEAGEMALNEDRFLPDDIILETITTIRGFSNDAADISIDIHNEAPTFHLLADPRIFKQIMLNLLSNAVKFTPSDGRITVTTGMGDDGGLVVQVRDTGRGIAREDLEAVIEPFGQSRAGSQTAHKGTGLGLSLSKILTELHGGALSLESEYGKGTTVTLRFPSERSVKAPTV